MNSQLAPDRVHTYGDTQGQVLICELCSQSQRLSRQLTVCDDVSTLAIDRLDQLEPSLQQNNPAVVVLPLGDKPVQRLDLLQRIADKHPDTVRIVIIGQLTPLQSARAAELAHQSLPADCQPETLLNSIQNSLHIRGMFDKSAVRDYIGSIKKLPVLPDVHNKLNELLASDRANARDIARVIEQDPAITAKIMQLVNSAYFGLSREISRIHEAVTILGVRMIRDLILSCHLFESFPQTAQWQSFSFQQIHQRSLTVARAAQHIARSVKADRHTQSQAFLAGLLHDFGTVLLATQNPDEYRNVLSKAELMGQPVYAIEKLQLGVTHAEAGAFLLALWNLPPRVVEAVLLHHFPKAELSAGFTPLTAVHVADALLPSVTSVSGCDLSSQLNVAYIDAIGMSKELDRWQLMLAEYNAQVGAV